MLIIPSIDILDGQCVRLIKGDFQQKTIYSDEPSKVASRFSAAGATVLHVVDLDGAKNGKLVNTGVLKLIANAFDGVVQVGGGIRSAGDIDKIFSAGVSRAVVGSLAVKEPQVTHKILAQYGADKIVLALDFKIDDNVPYIAVSGWKENTKTTLWQLLDEYPELKYGLITDISRDGLQTGANIALYGELKRRYPDLYVEASGGVSGLEDLSKLRDIGLYGAISGRAIYEGNLSLSEAIECLK
ncbi:1-(5-phosphoribosyl)-5-[(5-phosphoribosylamino)me thylideneamino]imidazole-4-carboxamide isomerase [Deferribacterales bacterium RsTz2092]|nr:1-(5-phosphoribosyl)-5-[(5-phosphoribosylamino) methylideneamino] imidazole-4-carboxamide isomerase [Deferribacterales bacterium]